MMPPGPNRECGRDASGRSEQKSGAFCHVNLLVPTICKNATGKPFRVVARGALRRTAAPARFYSAAVLLADRSARLFAAAFHRAGITGGMWFEVRSSRRLLAA
jgi:hypothetical protein